jgi:hypothetical protein
LHRVSGSAVCSTYAALGTGATVSQRLHVSEREGLARVRNEGDSSKAFRLS